MAARSGAEGAWGEGLKARGGAGGTGGRQEGGTTKGGGETVGAAAKETSNWAGLGADKAGEGVTGSGGARGAWRSKGKGRP